MQSRKRTAPWRQAKSLEDVVNTATLKMDLRSPCCLLRSGKLAIFVKQRAICLRQFLFCHLFFLTHTHKYWSPQGALPPPFSSSAEFCHDGQVGNKSFMWGYCSKQQFIVLFGVFFVQSQQKKTAPEGHGTEKQHWRSNFAYQSLNLRTSGCLNETKRFSWKKKKTELLSFLNMTIEEQQPCSYTPRFCWCVKVHALFNSWHPTDAAVFHPHWHNS